MREENDNRGLVGFLTIWAGQLVSVVGSGLTSFALGVCVRENGFVVLVFGTCCVCPVAKHPAAANGRRARRPLGSASDHDDGRHRRRRVHHRQCASLARRIPRLAAARGAHCPCLSGQGVSLAGLRRLRDLARSPATPGPSQRSRTTRRGSGGNHSAPERGLAGSPHRTRRSYPRGRSVVHRRCGNSACSSHSAASEGRCREGLDRCGGCLCMEVFPESIGALRTALLRVLHQLCAFGVVQFGITPLVLSFANAGVLGNVIAAGGLGAVLGSAVMSVWGGSRHRIPTILALTAVQACFAAVAGLRPNATLIGICLFGILFCFPIIAASTNVIWQTKVSPEVQGRVFAIRRMFSWSSIPIAYLCSGFWQSTFSIRCSSKEGVS